MEIENEVKVVSVDFTCPKCGTGRLRPTGTIFPTHPPQIPHKCSIPGCDFASTFNVSYPYLKYIEQPKTPGQTITVS